MPLRGSRGVGGRSEASVLLLERIGLGRLLLLQHRGDNFWLRLMLLQMLWHHPLLLQLQLLLLASLVLQQDVLLGWGTLLGPRLRLGGNLALRLSRRLSCRWRSHMVLLKPAFLRVLLQLLRGDGNGLLRQLELRLRYSL